MGYILQIFSIISFGTGNVLWKYLSHTPVFLIIAIRSLLTSVTFGIIVIFSGNSFNLATHTDLWIAFALSFISFWGLYFYNLSLKYGMVSKSVTITGTSAFIGALTAILILDNTFSINMLYGGSSILIGLILIDQKNISLKWSKATIYAFLAALFWGVTFALFKIPIDQLGAINFSFVLEVTVCFSALVLYLFSPDSAKKCYRPKKSHYRILVLLALTTVCGVFLYNKAVTMAPVSKLVVFTVLTPVISLVLSHLLFKETMSKTQYLGVIFINTGVFISYW